MNQHPRQITPFLAALEALQHLISRFDQRGIIIGGVAVSILGKPRLTADLDAMILLSIFDIPKLIEIAETVGIHARIDDALNFARENRILLMQHQSTGINIDISLGILPFEVEAVERSRSYQLADLSIRLPTPEDLIIFKAVAHRPRDLLDIQAIIENNPDLDWHRIESWVRQFAVALDMPELWDDVKALLIP